MKKALKIVGIVLLVIIVFILIAGLFVKKEYHLEKSVTINAPMEKVWEQVSTLAAMQKWSPWLEADPNAETSIDGQDGAVNAVYKWKGNKEVGSGTQTITKVDKPGRIDTHLHFIEPFEGDADAFIILANEGNATKATWGFDSKYTYPMNCMLLFIDMDEMMGKEFDKGLAKLKSLCEAP
ncbi:MAG: SRPBCC family protein [Chitinophagaceae bacterium]|nr:SRPBCC family protein [Chitinophagaceae bacterium]